MCDLLVVSANVLAQIESMCLPVARVIICTLTSLDQVLARYMQPQSVVSTDSIRWHMHSRQDQPQAEKTVS